MRIAIPILLAFATCLHGAEPTTLLPTNSTEGLTTGWGSKGGVQILALAKGPGDTTDGDGALHLSMTSIAGRGNKYLSMKVSLPAPVDLRSSRVLIDARTNHPETTKSFYVRFYNEGESEPAWSFNSWSGQLKKDWRTFSVQRHLCMDGLAWEAGVVGDRIADRVTRIEFIMGTSEDNVQVDMLIDNIRVAKRIGSLSELKIYKTILHDTVLVADGKAASIVLHPDSEAGRAAAATVIEAIRKATSATLTARPATESDRVFDETAILLGNLNTNPAMLLLYGRRLTPVDSVCPGKGGALVHTVFDPFGKGANAIILGASDDAGLARAASVFTDRVAKQGAPGELAFPRLFDRHYGKDFIAACSWADDEPSPKRLEQGLKAGQRRLDRGTHTSIAGELASVAKRYALTGHSVEAKLYVQLWDMYAKSAVADPRKFGGPWGFDSDFPSRIVVPGWDLIEEDPTLTDEERVSTLQHLGRWMAETVVPSCAGAATSTHLPHNHQTFPALGTMFAGIHMSQSFPKLMEGPFWLSIADRIFQRQATYFKPYEDCNGYQWLTNGHLFGYALARPDFTVFTNGNGKRIIDFCIGNMDNLGYQVPYGDTGSWVCWNSEMICLDRYAFATGDPVARWAANHKRDIKRTRLSAADYMQLEPGAKPTRFDGVRIWPLEPAFYETFPVDNRPPLNLCFDKVTFREALDSQAAYLLLDGLSNGGHKHYDGNSISRLTQFDRIWLADNDYYKQPVKFHNSMLVFRDGASEQIPAYTQLLGSGESDAYGYSRSRVNGYAGADWDRTIIWLKALKAFVILDKLTAIESGDYQFRLLWHGVGAAELTDEGMLLRQKGPSLAVQIGRGPRLAYNDDKELGTNWRGYTHADPVVRSLAAVTTRTLQKGESHLFATVLHGRADGDEAMWRLDWLRDGDGIRLRTPQGPVALTLGPLEVTVDGTRFVTDAQAVVADGGLTLLDATHAESDGEPIHSSATPTCADILDADTMNAVENLPTRAPRDQQTGATAAPEHKVTWELAPSPTKLLLSGNTNLSGSVRDFAKLLSDPLPADHNVFSAEARNEISGLTDGAWSGVETCVMYKPDQTIAITYTFADACAISGFAWKQWWASSSSKKTAYKLAKATVTVSTDGFRKDTRVFGSLAETGSHADWGDAIDYRIEGDVTNVRALRLTVTPQKGTAVYLAETYVYGTAPSATGTIARSAISRICALRGPGGGNRLAVGTKEGMLYVYDDQAKLVWSVDGTSELLDMTAVDLDGDGVDELATGWRNYHLTVHAADGANLWTRKLAYYRKPGYVNVVRSGDLDGDGKPELVCGGENWRFYAFSADGTELWNYESVHPSRSGAVADLDGDGKAETLCGTHYYWMSVLDGQGLAKWKGRFGPICWDIATGRADTKGRRNVITGSGGGEINAFDSTGKSLLKFNTGDEVRKVECGDLDGDGLDEFLAGSMNYSVYCYAADMSPLWRTDVGDAVSALATVPASKGRVVLAGTGGGRLVTLGADGAILASTQFPCEVRELRAFANGVAVSLADGRVLLLKPLP